VAPAAAIIRSSSLHSGLCEDGQPYLGTGIGRTLENSQADKKCISTRRTEDMEGTKKWRARLSVKAELFNRLGWRINIMCSDLSRHAVVH